MISYFTGFFNINIDQYKPFNPIWGETYNVKIMDWDVSIEQVLHHPPINNFYCSNPDKTEEFYGFYDIIADL